MRRPIEIPVLTAEELEALETLYRTTRRLLRRFNRKPQKTLPFSGPNPAIVASWYLETV